MAPDTGTAENLTPIFVSVKDAAALLGLSPWSTYRLLDDGKVEARYFGRRRLVVLASLQEYAKALPTERAGVESA
jgi:excisionase family DNA binding protein